MSDEIGAISRDIAVAVLAAGEDSFPAALLTAFRSVSGADLCSAFTVNEGGAPQHLCSAGSRPQIPRFAEVASHDYANNFWRRDAVTRNVLVGSAKNSDIHIVRQAWNGIADPEYRRACYERAGIVERVTLYRLEAPRIFVSAYRSCDSGSSSPEERERLEAYGRILLASVAKHAALRVSPAPPVASADEVVVTLLGADRGLSAREADIAAGLILGKTQQEIADEGGIALSSVVTYRKRAYRKLGVQDRRELLSLYRMLAKAR